MTMVSPGEVFFDYLADGRFERCILQPTAPDTPGRHAAARGGTGEFYRAIPKAELTPDRIDAAPEMIFFCGEFVFLERA